MTTRREQEQIEQLVQEHRGLVECIVDRYMRRFHVGTMEREDLISWGLIGLYHAARIWDESRNLQFSTLAWKVIERSIIRGVQREWSPAEAQATVSLEEMLFPAAADGGEETTIGQTLADPRAEAAVRRMETAVMVRRALDRLPARERDLIRERYYAGRSCAEIGERTGKSRQAIYLREKSILNHLRRDLGADFEDLAAA